MTAVQLIKSATKPTASAAPMERVASLISVGVSPKKIAIEAGVRASDLNAWLDQKPTSEKVEARIGTWLEELDNAAPVGNAWADTPTSRQIVGALQYARETPTIAVVYGGAGCSKTSSAQHYISRHRKTIYICASVYCRSPSGVLQALAEAAHCDHGHAYRQSTLAKAVLDSISPEHLIVVDEAQHLDAAALDGLRYFHDQGDVGIAYLGNEEVYRRISGKGRRAAFAQLHSRVGIRIHVPAPTEGDIDAVLEAWGVRGRDERQYAHHVASMPGGLRQLDNLVRHARVTADYMKRPVDIELLRAAAELLAIQD